MLDADRRRDKRRDIQVREFAFFIHNGEPAFLQAPMPFGKRSVERRVVRLTQFSLFLKKFR